MAGLEDVLAFFRGCLTHTKGALAGSPFVPSPWQVSSILSPLFGSVLPSGLRQYRTCYVEIPRKNGKSTLAAGVALYLLFADREPGAEVVSAAADRDQASIVFDIAKSMVQACPLLRERCNIYRKEIVTRNGNRYWAISADAFTKHGLSPSGIIFDELHTQPDRELWDVLTTGTGARRQPLTLALTTAGYDRSSICWEIHQRAIRIRDGIEADPTFLPVIFAADEGDDWTKETTWKKANPGYGVSVQRDYFERKVVEAMSSPATEQTFRRLHLDQWTESQTRWVSMDRWDACNGPVIPADLVGRECYAGLDLASTMDLCSLVLLFPDGPGYQILPYYWVPEAAARKRVREGRTPIDSWAHSGHIDTTPGDVLDYDRVRVKVNELSRTYNIRELAIDRWNATQLAVQLQGDGVNVVMFGQGYQSMSSPTKELEKLILARRVAHGGHPVLRWNVSNVTVEQDAAGNVKPSKRKSAEKIDGVVATIMALGRAMVATETVTGGVEVW